jgi:hypothetical protein
MEKQRIFGHRTHNQTNLCEPFLFGSAEKKIMDKLFAVEIKLVAYVAAETPEQAVSAWNSLNSYTKSLWHEGDEITAKHVSDTSQIPECDTKDYVYQADDKEYDKLVGEFLAERVQQDSKTSSIAEQMSDSSEDNFQRLHSKLERQIAFSGGSDL